MTFRRLALLSALGIFLSSSIALADWLMKDANGNFNTVFSYICQTTKICAAEVPTDQFGNPFGVSSNPFFDNITNWGGNPVATGLGLATTGSPRVAVSRDSQVQPWDGVTPTYVVPPGNPPVTSQGGFQVSIRPDGDPCAQPAVLKSNVAVNISSAVTQQLIGLVSGKVIYICGFSFSLPTSGTTAATFQLEYGTGTNCASSPIALTGAFGAGYATAGPPISYVSAPSNGTVAATASSNELCIVTAGTTINLQGHLTYVQQ